MQTAFQSAETNAHVFSLSLRCFRSFLTLVSVFAPVPLVNGERFETMEFELGFN